MSVSFVIFASDATSKMLRPRCCVQECGLYLFQVADVISMGKLDEFVTLQEYFSRIISVPQ